MKAHGLDTTDADDRRGQHMLTGVLLHVVESSLPVDLAVDGRSRQETTVCARRHGATIDLRSRDDMRDRSIVGVHDVDDAKTAEGSGVERLAASGGIERGSVERDG